MKESTALAQAPARALSPVPDGCVLCRGSRLSLRYAARGDGAAQDATAWRCTSFGHRAHPPIWGCGDCGLLFQWPMPRAAELARAYADVVDPLYMSERENRILTFRRVIRALGTPAGRRLLDVGAYCGYFLEVARERGFAAEGLELSRWAAGHARLLGFTVHSEPLVDLSRRGGRYDVLTMWDVLEHLPDPREELRAARDLLEPGGRLYLSTIDTGSLFARLLGARWPWLMDMHLVYFDRATVAAVLEETGFRVLGIRTYSHTVSAGYLLRKVAASFPVLAPAARLLARIVPPRASVPVNLGDNMLVVAERA
ncbi:MAG TPA: class I SAM-dependent methyltransferase [Anaeromyxobacteraceae bacterium]|nr:class I SAM-dependent methyltransferase [Anaeromyxobacteraceae bacterium]